MKEILISVVVSIIASLIWWTLSQLYSLNSRKIINYKLLILRNDNALYEKCLTYEDYDLALNQVERMLDKIGELYEAIKPLTYTPKKRKLIKTILSSLYIQFADFQSYYIGLNSEDEKSICCFEAKRKLFIVGFQPSQDGKHPNPDNFESASRVAIELLCSLNLSRFSSIQNILRTSQCFNDDKDIPTRKNLFKNLIDIRSFTGSMSKQVAVKFNITSDVFSRSDYHRLINTL